jgi:phosphoserine phosphatase RsbU/P
MPAVTSTTATQLKLYVEQSPKSAHPPVDAIRSLPQVLQAFNAATGWSLRQVQDPRWRSSGERTARIPLAAAAGAESGYLELNPLDAESPQSNPPATWETARRLAEALGGLLNELQETRQALWEREAELAVNIPLPPPQRSETRLAERLQAALKGGAEAVGCQAAALYLLDKETTELKMRSCWGLSLDRLAAPARQLKGCLPDLEALLGHAVVLENTALLPGWTAPEDFPAAVCVPVSSPTTLLGTAWFFGTQPREFANPQVNVLEIAAGKIAGDLERGRLLQEGRTGTKFKEQWAAAQRLHRHQLPAAAPLFDGWDIAGRTAQSQGIGGAFYDWFCLRDGRLGFAVGESQSRGMEAALTAGAVRTAVRAHGKYHPQTATVLQQVNLSLWTGFAGDQFTHLCYGLIETATGNVCWAAAGQPAVVLIRDKLGKSLTQTTPLLGESPETDFPEQLLALQADDVLAIFTPGFRQAADSLGRHLGEEGLSQLFIRNAHLSAGKLAALAWESLEMDSPGHQSCDSALLVIKRLT